MAWLKTKVTRRPTRLNKWVFSTLRNCPMERLMWQSPTRRLFHRRGPATAKERSPRRVRVHWMTHVLTSGDQSWRRLVCDELSIHVDDMTFPIVSICWTGLFFYRLMQIRLGPPEVFQRRVWGFLQDFTDRMPFLSHSQKCRSTERINLP